MRRIENGVLLTAACAVVLLCGGIERGARAQSYALTDLGTLGGSNSEALAINESGQIVGTATLNGGVKHGFLYEDGQMRDLGTLGGLGSNAQDINDSGQVVGSSGRLDDTTHVFIYENGTMTDLGVWGQAYAINNAGQVVGARASRAFLYDHGIVTDLGTLGLDWSEARDINDSGQVVGRFGVRFPTFESAFLYDGVMHDLNDLAAAPPQHLWRAWAINENGVITGGNFIFRDGEVTVFPSGLQQGKDINNLGDVVGGIGRAFLITSTAALDLNSVLPSNSGWRLLEANGINDAGQIVGTGRINDELHAYVLTPSTCGNGSLDTGEECDDANKIPADGCDPFCRVEFCFVCNGEPSNCLPVDGTDLQCQGDLSQCVADLDQATRDFLQCTTDLGQAQNGVAQCSSDLATCNSDLTQADTDLTQCQSDLSQSTAALGQCDTNLARAEGDLAQCNSNLGVCGSDLSHTSSDLTQCKEDLTHCITDPPIPDQDADGVADSLDSCRDTPESIEVDQAGCSLVQFCRAVDATTALGRRTCKKSDWKNDEPMMRSGDRDCGVDKGARGPDDDRCVPRLE